MANKKKYKIPFSKHDGHLISYDYVGIDNQVDDENVEYRNNYVFEDDLQYIRYNGGRSAMSMIVRSLRDGTEYSMFWTYFNWCIKQPTITPGPVFHGKWTFIKTGCNYSICPAEDGDETS